MSTHRTIGFHTLGCKLNFSETSSLRRLFEDAGYYTTNFEDGPDVYIVNTCSVTDFADRKCKKIVNKALSFNADAKVVLTGCYAQLKPEEISSIPGVAMVIGAAEKFNIVSHVNKLFDTLEYDINVVGDIHEVTQFESSFSLGDRTRSFLKVQDGCDYKCSFCTIPLARGKSRSDTIESVIEKAKSIESIGVKEIVLTGINLGDFGNGTEVIEGIRPKKESLFIDLLKEMDHTLSIPRIRISSIEPNLCTDEIIDFVANSIRIMPHFHIPLQSGNNKQLKAMRRRYTRELYADRVSKIKSIMPHACIGVDVIVGFPGETEEDFQESYKFIRDLDISYIHAFTYSERPNTDADSMDAVVPMHVRKERNKKLRILSDKKKAQFYMTFLGTEQDVLLEKSKIGGELTGFTKNYIKISVNEDKLSANSIQKLHLAKIGSEMKVHSVSMAKV